MPVIEYTTTTFVEPGRINEETYIYLKKVLSQDPNFEIGGKTENLSKKFSGLFKAIGISFGLWLFSFSFFDDGSFMIAIGGISMIFFIAFLVFLFLQAPSYATFVKKKGTYFSRMKIAITSSRNYEEFYVSFYSK